MQGFLIRLFVSSLSLWVASAIVPGMNIEGFGTLLLAALLFGIVNAVVRPVVVLLTLPFTILSLGFFLLVVNAAMLGIVAGLLAGFSLSGFGAAFLGAIIVGVVAWALCWTIGPKGNVEVMVVRKRG